MIVLCVNFFFSRQSSKKYGVAVMVEFDLHFIGKVRCVCLLKEMRWVCV